MVGWDRPPHINLLLPPARCACGEGNQLTTDEVYWVFYPSLTKDPEYWVFYPRLTQLWGARVWPRRWLVAIDPRTYSYYRTPAAAGHIGTRRHGNQSGKLSLSLDGKYFLSFLWKYFVPQWWHEQGNVFSKVDWFELAESIQTESEFLEFIETDMMAFSTPHTYSVHQSVPSYCLQLLPFMPCAATPLRSTIRLF